MPDSRLQVTTPKLMLKGFEKVSLQPGEMAAVSIKIDVADEL